MRIVVNTRLLRKNEMDGIGWFTFNSMKHIVRNNPSVEFHFLFDSGIQEEFLFSPNVVPHNLFPPAKHALLNLAWFEWSVRKILNKLNPDLFFSPDGLLCLGWNGRQHGVIHDLNFFHFPADLKWSNRIYYNHFFPKYAEKAVRLATVSNYSKQDIAKSFKVDPAKIDVVYCGINEFLHPVTEETKWKVKNRLTAGNEYFIFVGTLHPRKNLLRLLTAFDLFKTQTSAGMQLVIAGRPSYKAEDIYRFHSQMKYKKDVKFTGRIDDDEINDVMASAFATVFVPHFEGFGIPIVESMQCEVPVICSNTTSMPEVAADAALLVDPFDNNGICNAMVRMYAENGLREELVIKGRERKKLFSWEVTAAKLWNSIERCF
jgi:glycosyltransferase involved in cell wall biosynthesis